MLSELAFPHIRFCLSAIPSDLMNPTAVDESLSSMNQQFCSRENQLLQMLQQNEKSTQKKSIYLYCYIGLLSLHRYYIILSSTVISICVLFASASQCIRHLSGSCGRVPEKI